MSQTNGTATPKDLPKPTVIILMDCLRRLEYARTAIQALRMNRLCSEYPKGNAERSKAVAVRCDAFEAEHGEPSEYLDKWQASIQKA